MAETTRSTSRRIARERRTVQAMLHIYCRAHHGSRKALCDECQALGDYAMCRLDRCPFGCDKPACTHCPVHCYKPAMRAKIREVMRFAGPRMLLRHPLLALWHQWDSFRNRPTSLGRDAGSSS